MERYPLRAPSPRWSAARQLLRLGNSNGSSAGGPIDSPQVPATLIAGTTIYVFKGDRRAYIAGIWQNDGKTNKHGRLRWQQLPF